MTTNNTIPQEAPVRPSTGEQAQSFFQAFREFMDTKAAKAPAAVSQEGTSK